VTRPIPHEIAGNGKQPRARVARVGIQEAHERLLRRILSIIGAAGAAAEDADESRIPGREQAVDGRQVQRLGGEGRNDEGSPESSLNVETFGSPESGRGGREGGGT
jgi:hypothetical protein